MIAISKISNYKSMGVNPDRTWVLVQNGKARHERDSSALSSSEWCIAFPNKETADYFIEHYKPTVRDLREAMLKDDYTFWVLETVSKGDFFADDINMKKDYVYHAW